MLKHIFLSTTATTSWELEMKKLISTVILTAFTAVCSFSAVAGSDGSDKNKDTKSSQDKRDGDKYGKQPSSTSEIMKEQFPKNLSPEEKSRYRDQEVMDKKPYKQ
jgi:hypothetical protein